MKPDGWEVGCRIGVLVPHADVGPESELRAMAPADVGIFAARVPFGAMRAGGQMDPTISLSAVRDFAEPPHVDEAVELLADAPLDVIAYGFTSSAYVQGADGEAAMLDRLSERGHGLPVVAPCAGSVEALRRLDVQRMVLFSPPWFDAELNALGRRYYETAGFEVISAERCELPSAQTSISPAAMAEAVLTKSAHDAEAVVIGGNGFRAVGVIDVLEEKLGVPVLTANQVLLWAALDVAHAATQRVVGYGQVFQR